MAGKFVLSKGASGKFHFVLKAGNGETILTSEHYEAKASADKGNRVGQGKRAEGRAL